MRAAIGVRAVLVYTPPMMTPDGKKDCVIVAGPTASGKSAFGLGLAGAINGEIINADALQIYRDLRVLSARPSKDEEALAPHHLYGFLDGTQRCSAAHWAGEAAEVIAAVRGRGKVPILVGGTGFYLKALTEGLSPIPAVPRDKVAAAQELLESEGLESFSERVFTADPALAGRISPNDTQRLLRAWSVFQTTDLALSEWQKKPLQPVADINPVTVVLTPERDWLYQRCDCRFDMMVKKGALDEVKLLLDRKLAEDLPVMKAVGVPELCGYLAGQISLDEARDKATQATRNYAKRQMTWLRNQIVADISYNSQYNFNNVDTFFSKIYHLLLTP